MGQIIKGSPNVKVNGIPVGRVGDATLDSGGVSSVAGLTGGSNGVISTTDLQTALSLGSAAQLSTGTGADQIPTTADADSRYAQRSNNLSDLTNVATAVSNLRLANVATSGSYVDLNNKPTSWSWNVITSTPTTLAGYGIVDAVANSQVGVANGITPLGADAKISTTYMPTAVLGQVSYQGTWDASTGSPPTTTPTKGWYYIVTVSGSTNLSGITDWVVGDWAIYNGTAWNKVDNTDAVSSVAGLVGVISTASLQTALGLSTVATSGNYADLIGKPVLATVATTGNYADLNGKPTLGTAASQDTTAFATAAQGAKADNSVQLSNGYLAGADANTALTSGFYALASPSTNTPDASWTTVFTASGINGRAFQIAESWNGGKIYWRPYNAGTFGSWNEIWHTGNIDPMPKAGGAFTGSVKSVIGNDTRSFSVPNVYGSGGANYGGVVNGLYAVFNAYYNGAWVQEDTTKASGGYFYRADQNFHGFYSWPVGGALTAVVTIDSVGTISAEGTVRSTGAAPPSSGDGVELAYNGTGYLTSYDRTAGVYKPLNIRGSTTTIGASGTDMLKVDTSSWYFKNANSTALTRQPRIFVQSTDPGAAAADGDIWIW